MDTMRLSALARSVGGEVEKAALAMDAAANVLYGIRSPYSVTVRLIPGEPDEEELAAQREMYLRVGWAANDAALSAIRAIREFLAEQSGAEAAPYDANSALWEYEEWSFLNEEFPNSEDADEGEN